MNSRIFLLLYFIFMPRVLFSQLGDYRHYPIGKEVWSEPIRVDSFSLPARWGWACSLTQSVDTIYLESFGGDIYSSFRQRGIWQTPKKLNTFINNNTPVRHPTISKDGKRLYFSSWRGGYGAWDLYCSSWDSVNNDWGQVKNLGPKVNTAGTDYFAYELSPDTLYCVTDRWVPLGVCIFVKDKLKNDWKIIDSLNHPGYYHPFGGGDIEGLSVTADRKKAYFGFYVDDSLKTELHVSYWDNVNNRWGKVYRLNINTKGYKVQVSDTYSVWKGGVDEYPWISPDGKTLYFTSNRDIVKTDSNSAAGDIYISHLMVDENGDSVTAVSESNFKINLINGLNLLPSYPNPFNPYTTISYSIPNQLFVELKVFDLLGREVSTLVNEQKPSGKYKIRFDGSSLPSGVYIYNIQAGQFRDSKKLLLLK